MWQQQGSRHPWRGLNYQTRFQGPSSWREGIYGRAEQLQIGNQMPISAVAQPMAWVRIEWLHLYDNLHLLVDKYWAFEVESL
eukprot:CAMPEP_0181174758 /NCGR_PEP_ID=MMETSP1096-20121128/3714_1 /TAXON_ID=156174 ORGANISM="Chrysochromulina ericina, Strain CCMP281" /NCGR_SAMPLE_ID=MMETSP1096 /ASSEMBLY_ACC=CAM_ASM_000453 /LENGTH=81 /DNA_ID=CAMNT_0023262695 /DNA_START=518 /DNA_END=763 /DNA_ORIENTATION=-